MRLLTLKSLYSSIALICAGILCFAYLPDYPISMWDEARLANNALEMDLSGNWIVTTFDHVPDYGNVKFPLLIWLRRSWRRTAPHRWPGRRFPWPSTAILCPHSSDPVGSLSFAPGQRRGRNAIRTVISGWSHFMERAICKQAAGAVTATCRA